MDNGKVINWIIPVLVVALIISTAWMYINIRSKPVVTEEEIKLTVTPEYRVTSKNNLMIWSAGEILPPGMAAYFYSAEPEVMITPVFEISGGNQGVIDGTLQITSRLQAVNEKNQIYWSYQMEGNLKQKFSMLFGNHNDTDLSQSSNGIVSRDIEEFQVIHQPKYINKGIVFGVNEVNDLVTMISEELMFHNAVFQLVVTTSVRVMGTVNGVTVDKSISQDLPLVLQHVSFTAPEPKTVASQITISDYNNNTSNQTISDIIKSNVLQISTTLLLFTALIILMVINNLASSKAAIEHKRYKEWITEGTVEVKDRFSIHIHTLKGLVDLAIDLDKRVIYDNKVSKYYVLAEDLIYLHDPNRREPRLDRKPHLGKLLLDRRLLTPEQLELGLYYQRQIGKQLGESLIALGFVDETTLYSTLASQQGIGYYELDTRAEIKDTSWLEKMNIQTARALMALPLGKREDGRMVIASSEASKEGIREALQEKFETEIAMIATKPSIIYEALKRIDYGNRQRAEDLTCSKPSINNLSEVEILGESLSKHEREEFKASYYRGKIVPEQFLIASGLIHPSQLSEIPEEENVINWLVVRNRIPNELSNLLTGLNKIIQDMDWKARQENQVPDLLDLLLNANYLTYELVEWVKREVVIQGLPIEKLLLNNFLASQDTINHANLLIKTLASILK